VARAQGGVAAHQNANRLKRGQKRALLQACSHRVGAHTVSVDDVPIELTSIEFDLLRALAENRGTGTFARTTP